MRFTPAWHTVARQETRETSLPSVHLPSRATRLPHQPIGPPPPPRSLARSLAPLSRRREADFAHVHRRPPTGADTMRTGIYAATRANIKANLFHTRARDEERLSSHLRPARQPLARTLRSPGTRAARHRTRNTAAKFIHDKFRTMVRIYRGNNAGHRAPLIHGPFHRES